MPRSCTIALFYRFSEDAKKKLAVLVDFVEKECIPAEGVFHSQIPVDPVKRWQVIPPILEELKTKAKKLGLWNLFLSKAHYPEYAPVLSRKSRSRVNLSLSRQCRCRIDQPRILCHGRGHGS